MSREPYHGGQTARRRSGLSAPVGGGALTWDAAMMRALDECVRADLSVNETLERLGVSSAALSRGALLRVQQLLRARDGAG